MVMLERDLCGYVGEGPVRLCWRGTSVVMLERDLCGYGYSILGAQFIGPSCIGQHYVDYFEMGLKVSNKLKLSILDKYSEWWLLDQSLLDPEGVQET